MRDLVVCMGVRCPEAQGKNWLGTQERHQWRLIVAMVVAVRYATRAEEGDRKRKVHKGVAE